eukprot:gene15316-biopygen12721
MGPEVGPAFQRRSRATRSLLASGWRERCPGFFALFAICHGWEQELRIPTFAPRSGPLHALAPSAQMIRMAAGTSGWRTGGLNVRTSQERDREQVGQVRCRGGPRGGGGFVSNTEQHGVTRSNTEQHGNYGTTRSDTEPPGTIRNYPELTRNYPELPELPELPEPPGTTRNFRNCTGNTEHTEHPELP